jgi:Zn-dependent M28 family amino/carboxypeptidase
MVSAGSHPGKTCRAALKLLALGVLWLALGCGGSRKAVSVDANLIGETVSFLAADSLEGRDTGSPGLEKAAAYLEAKLESYKISSYFDTYRDTLSDLKVPAYNIVGYIPGSDPALAGEIVLLGAHYDHIGTVPPVEGDGIANGANDNASGTAMLLELARNLAGGKAPARSLLIAFFSAEERGLLGSDHLAKKLKANNVRLYAMLNFEMVGVPMPDKPYLMYLTGYETSNLAELSNQYGGEGLVGFLPQAAEYNLFQRSDNYTFYKQFQVPAQTYSTFDFTNYQYYHQPGDEAGRMDIGHMAALVTRMVPVVRGIANASGNELILK